MFMCVCASVCGSERILAFEIGFAMIFTSNTNVQASVTAETTAGRVSLVCLVHLLVIGAVASLGRAPAPPGAATRHSPSYLILLAGRILLHLRSNLRWR